MSILEIIRGSDVPSEIQLQEEKNGVLSLFDLTGADDIEACFIDENDTVLSKKLSGGGVSVNNAISGLFQIDWDESETQLLPDGTGQSFDIIVTKLTKTYVWVFNKRLTVIRRACEQ